MQNFFFFFYEAPTRIINCRLLKRMPVVIKLVNRVTFYWETLIKWEEKTEKKKNTCAQLVCRNKIYILVLRSFPFWFDFGPTIFPKNPIVLMFGIFFFFSNIYS